MSAPLTRSLHNVHLCTTYIVLCTLYGVVFRRNMEILVYLNLNCRDVVDIHVGCRVNSFSFCSSIVLSTRGWRYLDFITTFRRYCDLILMSLLNTNTAPDPRGASQLQAQRHQGFARLRWVLR